MKYPAILFTYPEGSTNYGTPEHVLVRTDGYVQRVSLAFLSECNGRCHLPMDEHEALVWLAEWLPGSSPMPVGTTIQLVYLRPTRVVWEVES